MFENRMLDLVFAPWCTNVVFAANRLRVFTLLADDELTAVELGERIGGGSQLLTAALDACVAMGLLLRNGDRYRNSHLSYAYLVEGKPQYISDFIDVQACLPGDGRALAEAVAAGRDSVAGLSEVDLGCRRFTLGMHGLAMQGDAEALATAVDLSGCSSMADVGCGSGAYSFTLCRHYACLRSRLLDRPEVLEVAGELARREGLEDRIELCPGDITACTYGDGLDAVLLSDVLYQDKPTCVRILRSAREALTDGGKLIIRGYYSDPNGSESLFGALFVINVQLLDEGREPITLARLRNWVGEAGFKDITTFTVTSRSTCLVAVR